MARTRSQPVEEAPAGGAYPAWARSVAEVESHWHVNVARGLSEAQVTAQRVQFGFNELDKEQSKPLWKLVLEQFDDPLVKVRQRTFLPWQPPRPRTRPRSPTRRSHAPRPAVL
jgi:magnesium-transporting ATPase (P-type)